MSASSHVGEDDSGIMTPGTLSAADISEWSTSANVQQLIEVVTNLVERVALQDETIASLKAREAARELARDTELQMLREAVQSQRTTASAQQVNIEFLHTGLRSIADDTKTRATKTDHEILAAQLRDDVGKLEGDGLKKEDEIRKVTRSVNFLQLGSNDNIQTIIRMDKKLKELDIKQTEHNIILDELRRDLDICDRKISDYEQLPETADTLKLYEKRLQTLEQHSVTTTDSQATLVKEQCGKHELVRGYCIKLSERFGVSELKITRQEESISDIKDVELALNARVSSLEDNASTVKEEAEQLKWEVARSQKKEKCARKQAVKSLKEEVMLLKSSEATHQAGQLSHPPATQELPPRRDALPARTQAYSSWDAEGADWTARMIASSWDAC